MPEDHPNSPLDRLAGLVPVDALLRQVDVNELLDRVDIERLLARLDLEAIVGQSVKAATRGTLDILREQLAHLDSVLSQAVDRILRRGDRPAAPDDVPVPTAGVATRLPAFVIDLVLALVTFATVVTVAISCVDFVTGAVLHVQVHPELGIPAIVAWLFFYFFGSWAITGRTPGMALIGLRVVSRESSHLPVWRAATRTLVLPVSFVGGVGLLGILLGSNHRALHDVAAGTRVVYASDELHAT
jgi:uncharacterized RDD family membrane protein YckC